MSGTAVHLASFSPLTEGAVETTSSAFANLVTNVARDVVLVGQPAGKTSHDLLFSGDGIGGTAYAGLKKGTAAYTTPSKHGYDLYSWCVQFDVPAP